MEASDGAEGLEMALTKSPDLILLNGRICTLDDESTGYFVQFLSGEHRVRLLKWLPGRIPDGRPWFTWEVVQEVPFVQGAESVHVRLLVVGGEVELSVDGRVLLSEITRVRAEGRVGVFAVSGSVMRRPSLTCTVSRWSQNCRPWYEPVPWRSWRSWRNFLWSNHGIPRLTR